MGIRPLAINAMGLLNSVFLSQFAVTAKDRVWSMPSGIWDMLCAGQLAMTAQEFRESLELDLPPAELSLALAGLWWAAKGDWTKAHESAQRDEGPAGAWVHAYLHRKEGDLSNAAYWYQRAGKSLAHTSLEKEWDEIVDSLLK